VTKQTIIAVFNYVAPKSISWVGLIYRTHRQQWLPNA